MPFYFPSVGSTVEISEIESLPKGTIIVGDGNGAPATLAPGSNGQSLVADSSAPVGLKYDTISGGGGYGPEYTHTQSSALATWSVNHNLNRQPNVVIVVNDQIVEASVTFTNLNTATVEFSSAQTGTAYCF